jgi:hypothetical protein
MRMEYVKIFFLMMMCCMFSYNKGRTVTKGTSIAEQCSSGKENGDETVE